MPHTPTELLASSWPTLTSLIYATAALYLLSLALVVARPAWARPVLLVGALVHLVATTGRGIAIGFLPLTNKMESFSAAALGLALVALVAWRPSRIHAGAMLALTCAAMAAALRFPLDMAWPPPLMRTIWYPLHVPLSFLGYGTFAAAAASGLAWIVDRDDAWLVRIDRLALWALALWSLSMVCGGVWGVLAWGSYFLWDPKVIWSVILWFHCAALTHVRFSPWLAVRPWVRPALALAGLAWVLVAYVGTSFLFGASSHAWS